MSRKYDAQLITQHVFVIQMKQQIERERENNVQSFLDSEISFILCAVTAVKYMIAAYVVVTLLNDGLILIVPSNIVFCLFINETFYRHFIDIL